MRGVLGWDGLSREKRGSMERTRGEKELIQRKRISQAIGELTITNPTFITSGGNSRAHVERNEVY